MPFKKGQKEIQTVDAFSGQSLKVAGLDYLHSWCSVTVDGKRKWKQEKKL